MMWSYAPAYDPSPKDPATVPAEVQRWLHGEEMIWEGTSHLPNFKEDVLTYWAACLTLARKLVRIFALSLDLEEDYFDEKTTYPGADGVFNYYPPTSEEQKRAEGGAIGLGIHTDLQLFTLLWQDLTGGLYVFGIADVGNCIADEVACRQILTKEGQWIKATPIEGTIAVNIGDFMMRLCNDMYKYVVPLSRFMLHKRHSD
jgi:isopenicillin N synthase-like dioxygenase